MNFPNREDVQNIGILGVGSCLGESLQDNGQLANQVANYDPGHSGRSLDEWIRLHYGIVSRTKTNRLPSELAADACRKALDAAGLDATDIDFLLLNTVAGDYRQPSTATEVQGKVGMRVDSFALEVNMPCAGNIYGIVLAKSMIAGGVGKKALVVGVDKMSDIVDPSDFFMSGMFGDAAGACIIGPDAGLVINDFVLYSRQDTGRALSMPSSGSADPVNCASIEARRHYLRQLGKPTSEFILEALSGIARELMDRSSLEPDRIIRVIPHQASRPLVEKALSAAGISPGKVEFTIAEYGNTSSASVLVTLDHYLERVNHPGGPMILAGMGAGLNWGGILLNN